MKTISAALLLLLCIPAFADEPAKPELKGDAQLVQGLWQATRLVKNGREKPAADIQELTLEFRGNQILSFRNGEEKDEPLTFTLDASKDPKWINMIKTRRDPAPNNPPPVILGIYKLDGDTLTLFYPNDSTGESPRPTAFEDPPKGRTGMIVLTRVKKAEEK